MKIYQINSNQRREEQKLMNWALGASTLVAIITGYFVSTVQLNFFGSFCGTMLPSAVAYLVFIIVAKNRRWKSLDEEKQALQKEHDAQDNAMFGKPLREIEL